MEVGRENECPESGEFFFHGRLRQKFSLKVDNSAQNWLSPHVISHFLIDQPRTSALGAAVELLFCLPPVWESSATNLGFSLNCISQLDLFHICFHPLFCLPPVWESSSTNLGFSLKCIFQLDFFHICFHPLWLPHNLVSVTRMMRG